MEVGTTVTLEIQDRRDGYLKADHDEYRFSIAGEGTIGERQKVRVIQNRDDTVIAVTEGALIRLRIDDVVDDSTVRADPAYGPVFVPTPLTPGDWWRCVVTDVDDDHLIARPRQYIPRNSDIPRGAPPEDHTQSLNHLLGGRKP